MFRGSEGNLTSHLIDQVNSYTINLLRVAAGTRREVLRQLQELEDELAWKVERITGKADFTAARLRTLLAQTRDTIATAYGDISEFNLKQLRGIVKATMTNAIETINAAIYIPLINVALSSDQIKAIAGKTLIQGAPSRDWWKQQSASLQAKFARTMRLGLYQAEDIGKLVQRVRGTKAMGFTDGIMNVPRHEAEALVRTSAITIANTARLQTYLKNVDTMKGLEWVSTLDGRTTEICIALDGKVWSFPESGDAEDYGGYTPVEHDKNFPGPTAHWQCRSTQVPVLKAFTEMRGKGAWDFKYDPKKGFEAEFQKRLRARGFSAAEAKTIQADTRASMDGQVGTAGGGGFDSWLSGKSKTFQDELLGKKEAALWRGHKIILSDLTDQNNRPLAVADLR